MQRPAIIFLSSLSLSQRWHRLRHPRPSFPGRRAPAAAFFSSAAIASPGATRRETAANHRYRSTSGWACSATRLKYVSTCASLMTYCHPAGVRQNSVRARVAPGSRTTTPSPPAASIFARASSPDRGNGCAISSFVSSMAASYSGGGHFVRADLCRQRIHVGGGSGPRGRAEYDEASHPLRIAAVARPGKRLQRRRPFPPVRRLPELTRHAPPTSARALSSPRGRAARRP